MENEKTPDGPGMAEFDNSFIEGVEKRRCGREIAAENKELVLYWLHRFGGLTTWQLARLIWPHARQAERAAQRTTERLSRKSMLLRRKLKTGGHIHVIGEGGAAFLVEQGYENVRARGDRDLGFEHPLHRAISNDFLIDRHLGGCKIWTEHEIQRGLAPAARINLEGMIKIPDGLFEEQDRMTWIEVENAAKKQKNLDELMKLASYLLRSKDTPTFRFDEEDFIFHDMMFLLLHDRNHNAVVRAIAREIARIQSFSDISNYVELVRVEMSWALKWGGVTSQVSGFNAKLIDGKDSKKEPG